MFLKFSRNKIKPFVKHGAKMRVYFGKKQLKGANFVYTEVNGGHYEEFYHTKSTFIYYILSGKGTFFLNGRPAKVKSADVLLIKPKTKIYYLGKMKLLLFCTPAWEAKYEKHVRYIEH